VKKSCRFYAEGAFFCFDDVRQYTEDLFDFINIDGDKINQIRHVARDLGDNLEDGILAAVLSDQHGDAICATNHGELLRARRYSSMQELKFERDVVERSRIVAPDSVFLTLTVSQ